jgi:hypothetical protein
VELGARDRATWAMAVELGDVALVRASWGKWRVLGEVLEREAQADVWRRGVLLRRAWSSLRWMTHLVMAGGGGRGETNEKLGEASEGEEEGERQGDASETLRVPRQPARRRADVTWQRAVTAIVSPTFASLETNVVNDERVNDDELSSDKGDHQTRGNDFPSRRLPESRTPRMPSPPSSPSFSLRPSLSSMRQRLGLAAQQTVELATDRPRRRSTPPRRPVLDHLIAPNATSHQPTASTTSSSLVRRSGDDAIQRERDLIPISKTSRLQPRRAVWLRTLKDKTHATNRTHPANGWEERDAPVTATETSRTATETRVEEEVIVDWSPLAQELRWMEAAQTKLEREEAAARAAELRETLALLTRYDREG